MNVGNSCLQLKEKVEKIGGDLDSIILRNCRSVLQKLQTNYPDFSLPDFSFEISSRTTCSRIVEDAEMKDAVSSTPQANTTLKRGASRGSRAAAAESVSKAKKTRVETSPPAQPLSVNPKDTKTPRGPNSVETVLPQSGQLKTPVRKTPPASTVPVLNQTYKKPNKSTHAQEPFVGLTSPTVALFGDTQHTPPKAVANPAIQLAKLSLPKSSPVNRSRQSRVSTASVMTEDSDVDGKRSGGRAGEALATSSTVTPTQDGVPTCAASAAEEVRAAPAAPLMSTVGQLLSATSGSTATAQTPWSSGAGTWLSRLGWLKSTTAATAPTAATPLPRVPEQEGRSGHLSKTQLRLQLKNTCTTPRQILASNRLPSALKQGYRPGEMVIREASLPSASTAKFRGSNQHLRSAAAITERQLNEQARAEDIVQRMAAKEERLRQLAEERERERLARVKAQREHIEAVRANARRLAKERQQAVASKLAAEQRQVQRQQQNQSSSFKQNKTSTSFKINTSAKAPNYPPLLNKSSNQQQQQAGTQPQPVNNVLKTVFENFDCVVGPPTISKPIIPTAAAATTKTIHPATAPSIKDSPVSYDMTGLLSEYDSDSDNEARRKKRPIPSWARAGGQQLIDMVTHCRQVKWQSFFRPAETIHFTDDELFHGYNYRSRKRGSSVVWLSPSSGACV